MRMVPAADSATPRRGVRFATGTALSWGANLDSEDARSSVKGRCPGDSRCASLSIVHDSVRFGSRTTRHARLCAVTLQARLPVAGTPLAVGHLSLRSCSGSEPMKRMNLVMVANGLERFLTHVATRRVLHGKMLFSPEAELDPWSRFDQASVDALHPSESIVFGENPTSITSPLNDQPGRRLCGLARRRAHAESLCRGEMWWGSARPGGAEQHRLARGGFGRLT